MAGHSNLTTLTLPHPLALWQVTVPPPYHPPYHTPTLALWQVTVTSLTLPHPP